jgi:hypothetical protein
MSTRRRSLKELDPYCRMLLWESESSRGLEKNKSGRETVISGTQDRLKNFLKE